MNRFLSTLSLFLTLVPTALLAQYSPPDGTALEAIFVERYYVSDTLDVTDEDGGFLDTCSVTYRVYVDLKPEYRLQAVYGNARNLLKIETETVFFNNEDRGEVSGDLIGANFLDNNTVALDSWVTMGPASNAHWGIQKTSDSDGSIVGGSNNDGGSEAIEGGLLVYNNLAAGVALTEADGLLSGVVPTITAVGLDLSVFDSSNSGSLFETMNGAWSVLEGVVGPTEDNIILIGQFTTRGQFDFQMNIQIGIPPALQCQHPDCHSTIQYVAELHPLDAVPGVENDNKFPFAGLTYVSEPLFCDFDSSVLEEDLSIDFSAFPNPTSGMVQISIDQKVGQELDLEVYDVLGNLVHSVNYGNVSNHFNAEVDLSASPAGAYTFVVRSENGARFSRIVKY
ncbi:MAG: T9SS type A sorting domain-containing protein [Cryomorphaceae bacterium]|nr:T9SS type A sorting domain-containing protein [Cryomorphaceae bacterium]